MTKTDAIQYFGGVVKTAKALGISHVSVSKWPESIPIGRQYQIQILTNGKLKAAA